MKKLFFFAASLLVSAAMFAAPIDLSAPEKVEGENAEVKEITVDENGVIAVTYNIEQDWSVAGVAFAIEPLNPEDLELLSFEFKDAVDTDPEQEGSWSSFFAYFYDEDGLRWFGGDAVDLSLGSTEWEASDQNYFGVSLWDGAEEDSNEKPFVKVAFIANPMTAREGQFFIQNLDLLRVGEGEGGEEEAVESVFGEVKAVKMVQNGQLVIRRGNRIFNALGAEL